LKPSHHSDQAHKPALLANTPIGLKLLCNALLPLLLFAAFTGWQQYRLGRVERSVSHDIAATVGHAVVAKDLQRDVVQVQQFLSDVSATRGRDGLDDGFKEAAAHRASFIRSLAEFRTYLQALGDQAGLTQLETLSAHFEPYYVAGVAMAHAYVDGGPEQGNALMPAFDKNSQVLQDSLDAFVNNETARAQATIAQVEGTTATLLWASLGACFLMSLLVAASNYVVYRSVVRPIQVAADVAVRIARGDLRHRFVPKGRDEIGVMLGALSEMQDNLRALILRVRQGVEQVDHTSSNISRANSDLSGRTEEQAAALEQTSSSMQQLDVVVRQNVVKAEAARQTAERARRWPPRAVRWWGRW
jgi:methyl-accepting chemotaxis protein